MVGDFFCKNVNFGENYQPGALFAMNHREHYL